MQMFIYLTTVVQNGCKQDGGVQNVLNYVYYISLFFSSDDVVGCRFLCATIIIRIPFPPLGKNHLIILLLTYVTTVNKLVRRETTQ